MSRLTPQIDGSVGCVRRAECAERFQDWRKGPSGRSPLAVEEVLTQKAAGLPLTAENVEHVLGAIRRTPGGGLLNPSQEVWG